MSPTPRLAASQEMQTHLGGILRQRMPKQQKRRCCTLKQRALFMSPHLLAPRTAPGRYPRFVPTCMQAFPRSRRLLLVLICCGAASAHAQTPTPPPPLLPPTFAGMHLTAPAATQTGPAAAASDPTHSALLREDGLLDSAQGTYIGTEASLGAGANLTVRAWRFGDATGAYAAFTALRQPQMRAQSVGVEGVSLADHYLFWTGAAVVDATLTRPDAHAIQELRTLADALPKPRGPAAVPPPVRGYLPEAGLQSESVHYAIGPAGYAAAGAPLPESVIDFSRDAEVVSAHYRASGGLGTLTLLDYPTPQIAANRLQAIEALLKSGAPPLTVGDPALVAERVGPLVAFTAGSLTAAEAHALIRGIHYEAAVTINHPEGYISEVSKAAKLLLGIAYLTGILAVAAVLLALFLGGGRVALRRFRGLPDSSMNDDDFISLKLR